MTKKIILIITVGLIYISSYGQNKNDDYKNMLDSAIIMQKLKANDDSYRTGIYLIDANNQAYILTSEINRKKFDSFNVYDKKNKKLLRDGVNAWKILPELNKDKLIINIVDFTITYKNNKYNFANGGGATVVFEYSCDKNKWVLVASKWGGI